MKMMFHENKLIYSTTGLHMFHFISPANLMSDLLNLHIIKLNSVKVRNQSFRYCILVSRAKLKENVCAKRFIFDKIYADKELTALLNYKDL